MGSTLFRDPQARSSALAALGTLQPRAFRSLNRIDPLDLVSNYYIDSYSCFFELLTQQINHSTHTINMVRPAHCSA